MRSVKFHLTRSSLNPILGPDDWGGRFDAVFNPGAFVLPSGNVALVVRVSSIGESRSRLVIIESPDGLSNWSDPMELPTVFLADGNRSSLEDARVTWLDELGRYLLSYTIYSSDGARVGAALTDDFKRFESLSTILPVENKNATIFPSRIGGRWWMLHRPTPAHIETPASIWLCTSPDLRHWGDHKILVSPRLERDWESFRVGVGPPPILSDHGWVVVYHGVSSQNNRFRYALGALLLDADDPQNVISRTSSSFLEPEATYELVGPKDVVFCNGLIVNKTRDIANVYYGASDTFICTAHFQWSSLVDALLTKSA